MPHEKPRILIPLPTSADQPYNQQCWKHYAEAVREAGGEPVEVALTTASLRSLLDGCDGVCLPGSPADVAPERYGVEREPDCSPADPAREAVDFALLDWAAAESKPVLGICYGLQSLNVWLGGTLVQDLHSLPVNHSAGASVAVAHSALVAGGSHFASLLGAEEARPDGDFLRLPVNSSHHQAVASPGDGLRVVARCPDDGVVEAVEMDVDGIFGPRPSWLVGVQWHPERSTGISAASRSLFRKLVFEAQAARTSERR